MIGCLWGMVRGIVGLVLLLAGGLVLLFIGYALFMPSDWMTAHYATHQEAVADGGIERGWIPEFVPERATNISDRHNLDTNDLQVDFSFTGGFEDFTTGLDRVPDGIRSELLTAQAIDQWWRERSVAFVSCRDRTGRSSLLLVASGEGRAMYKEPLRAAALAVLDPCMGKSG